MLKHKQEKRAKNEILLIYIFLFALGCVCVSLFLGQPSELARVYKQGAVFFLSKFSWAAQKKNEDRYRITHRLSSMQSHTFPLFFYGSAIPIRYQTAN